MLCVTETSVSIKLCFDVLKSVFVNRVIFVLFLFLYH